MLPKKYVDEMTGERRLHGICTLDQIGHPLEYYALRKIFLDCRGTLKIHPESEWGWFVTVITQTHDISTGNWFVGTASRTVIVDEHAWICSNALLYNCHIKHHGIVACGAVVRNMTVEPYTIVVGNPAVPIKRFVDGKWEKIERTEDDC